MRQARVEGALQGGQIDGMVGFEMGNLAQGVNAGIGAPGAQQDDFFMTDFTENILEDFLNRRTHRLNLPTMVMSAAVLDGEFDVALKTQTATPRRR